MATKNRTEDAKALTAMLRPVVENERATKIARAVAADVITPLTLITRATEQGETGAVAPGWALVRGLKRWVIEEGVRPSEICRLALEAGLAGFYRGAKPYLQRLTPYLAVAKHSESFPRIFGHTMDDMALSGVGVTKVHFDLKEYLKAGRPAPASRVQQVTKWVLSKATLLEAKEVELAATARQVHLETGAAAGAVLQQLHEGRQAHVTAE